MNISRERLKQVLKTPLYRNSLYLVTNTVVLAASGFVFWILAAHLYPEASVGYAAAILSAVGILTTLGLFGLDITTVHHLPTVEQSSAQARRLINTFFFFGGIGSLLATGIFIAGLSVWSPKLVFIQSNIQLLLLLMTTATVWSWSDLLGAVFIARQRAVFTLCKGIIFGTLRIALVGALGLLIPLASSSMIVTAWCVALILGTVFSIVVFLPRVEKGIRINLIPDWSLFRKAWAYARWNFAYDVLSTVLTFILPLLVLNVLGPEKNAYFYIAWSIVAIVAAAVVGISHSLLAASSNSPADTARIARQTLKFAAVIVVPATIVIIAAGKWILLIFGTSYSANSLDILRLLALGCLPQTVNLIYFGLLRSKGKMIELVTMAGLIVVGISLGSYLLMPTANTTGIGIAFASVHGAGAIYAVIRWRHITQRGEKHGNS